MTPKNPSPSKRGRIALCTELPIRDFGGTEVLVAALTRGLAEYFEIVLVSRDSPEGFARSGLAPFVETHVPWRGGEISVGDSKALAAQLAALKVDLAHFHFGANYSWGNRVLNRTPLIYVRKVGIPCLTTNHGAFGLLYGYCAPWRPLWLKLALLPFAWVSKMQMLLHLEEEVAVSQHDLHSLRRWYWPVRAKFSQVYHSKIPREATGAPIVPMSEREKTILCVGTIGFRKGQEVLTEAFAQVAARHPDWRLVLAGRCGEPALLAKINEIRARFHLEGRIKLISSPSDEEVLQLMQTAAIFAMPSFHEGLGLSLQEALFQGCACVGSRVEGIPELIQHDDNGLLVPSGDVSELATVLERLIKDELLRERLSCRARLSILEKGMTIDQMVQKYLSHYDALLENR